ncbi:Uncharacterised protein [Mycobacteroides abscessus subsp. abscessus]|nr:Uncharacterised protein [Mycobacteroides abscessus subsp. abscessus]
MMVRTDMGTSIWAFLTYSAKPFNRDRDEF